MSVELNRVLDKPTPELVTYSMQLFWAIAGNEIGKRYDVEPFPRKSEDLSIEKLKRRMPIYVPHGISINELSSLWSELDNPILHTNYLVSPGNKGGWLWVEDSVEAPGLTGKRILEEINKGNIQGQSLETYIVLGLIMHWVKGMYIDQGDSKTLLIGTTFIQGVKGFDISWNGLPINAYFEPNGKLVILPFLANLQPYNNYGFRSQEVIETR